MEWSEDQNLALVREVLIREPYRFKARTTQRGKVWQQIAYNLNSDLTLKFPSKNFGFFLEKLEHKPAAQIFFQYKIVKVSIKQDFNTISKSRKHYFILSRHASTQRNFLNLNLFFLLKWRRPRCRLSPANPRSLYRRAQGILRSLIFKGEIVMQSDGQLFNLCDKS